MPMLSQRKDVETPYAIAGFSLLSSIQRGDLSQRQGLPNMKIHKGRVLHIKYETKLSI